MVNLSIVARWLLRSHQVSLCDFYLARFLGDRTYARLYQMKLRGASLVMWLRHCPVHCWEELLAGGWQARRLAVVVLLTWLDQV